MNGAELVQLTEAARAFGISQKTLQGRLDGGALPEAVQRDDEWSLPSRALAAIADREGWPLDLTSETLAAHAAVVLAKTQATAARAETQEVTKKLKLAAADLDAERAERERATAELAEVRDTTAELDKERAVAEARAEEIRQQLDHERSQRTFLAQRIGTLERERDDLHAALGWTGRRRLRRSRADLDGVQR